MGIYEWTSLDRFSSFVSGRFLRSEPRLLLPPRVSFFFFLVAEISSHTGQNAAVAFFSSPPLLRATSCMTTAFMPPSFQTMTDLLFRDKLTVTPDSFGLFCSLYLATSVEPSNRGSNANSPCDCNLSASLVGIEVNRISSCVICRRLRAA